MNPFRSLALRVSDRWMDSQYVMPTMISAMKVTGMPQPAVGQRLKTHCMKWPIAKKKSVMGMQALLSGKYRIGRGRPATDLFAAC